MKICLYEPDPRVCGPMSWAEHLRTGFEALGHTVQQVSSTKSGRARKGWGTAAWGGHWWSAGPSLVCKDDDLGKVFNGFDLVILPEPKSALEDKTAIKEHRWPLYYMALWETKTPFITALHGNDYTAKTAPFAPYLLALPNFVGKLISHSERSRTSDPFIESLPYFSVPLPYAPTKAITDPFPVAGTVGTTGRFMFNKGCHLVALAARDLPADTTVELWGSCSTGLGTNATFLLYEAMLPYAAKYIRYGDQEEKRAAGDPKVTEHGNTIRPYHWDMRLNEGPLIRYLGNYTDPVGIASRLSVHVNLTSEKYSGGLVEFSTLEAMDAGSLCIAPSHVSDPRYNLLAISLDTVPGSVAAALKKPAVIRTVADTTNDALVMSGDTKITQAIVEHNRETLRLVSDPAAIALRILEESL